jgi:hypothetical protein
MSRNTTTYVLFNALNAMCDLRAEMFCYLLHFLFTVLKHDVCRIIKFIKLLNRYVT